MAGYVFVSNSTKPSLEENNSREKIMLSNVSKPCLEVALDMDYEVFLGINRNNPENLECELPVKLYDSHTYRSLFALKDNWIAYKNLSKIVKNNNIEVIHCNTPIGGVIGRLVGKRYKVKTVIYTAHGFHFYKGGSKIKNFIFKWAEKILAKGTDVIITMNEEDFCSAKKFKLKKNGQIYKVHGVGISLSNFENYQISFNEKRLELGLSEEDIVCISAGDLIPRKNYGFAIKSIAKVANKKIHYLVCGTGPELKKLQELSREHGVSDQIHFLGYRTDLQELMQISDIFLLTSFQEGLPRSMMEAMASGLPCVGSEIRGNIDLVEDGKGGYLEKITDLDKFSNSLKKLVDNAELRISMGQYNTKTIKKYDIKNVKKEIELIYANIMRRS